MAKLAYILNWYGCDRTEGRELFFNAFGFGRDERGQVVELQSRFRPYCYVCPRTDHTGFL